MGAKANPNRRADIAAALKRAKPNDMMSLEDLAYVWGTTKGPFVTAKKNMAGMPPPIAEGTSHIYAAKPALKAMLDYVMRHDAAAAGKQRRVQAILGTLQRDRMEDATASGIPVNDLKTLNRLAAEVEEREIAQRLVIPAAEVAFIAGEVFSALSEMMAGLSNAIDPNGMLPAAQREMIDQNSSAALIGFHRTMKQILDADADTGRSRGTNGGAGRPRPRRKRA